jgi:methionine synthase II (cobalamin-independent)
MDDPSESYKLIDYATMRSYLESHASNAETKITITGPMTLGLIYALGDTRAVKALEDYDDIRDERIHLDCSSALQPLVEMSLDTEAYVQIDEPSLTLVKPEYGGKILKKFFEDIPNSAIDSDRVSLHVCGHIGKELYKELMDLRVNVLSFGFSGEVAERKNFDVISRESLEDNGKKLGVGFISNIDVEDVKVVKERLKRLEDVVGLENIAYVHPDCGFGSTQPELVEPILKNMEKVLERYQAS